LKILSSSNSCVFVQSWLYFLTFSVLAVLLFWFCWIGNENVSWKARWHTSRHQRGTFQRVVRQGGDKPKSNLHDSFGHIVSYIMYACMLAFVQHFAYRTRLLAPPNASVVAVHHNDTQSLM
jgi:hypothetical protein